MGKGATDRPAVADRAIGDAAGNVPQEAVGRIGYLAVLDCCMGHKSPEPDAIRVTLTYINCSAAVKALSDIIVTSSNAEKIVRSIPEGQEILSPRTAISGRSCRRR